MSYVYDTVTLKSFCAGCSFKFNQRNYSGLTELLCEYSAGGWDCYESVAVPLKYPEGVTVTDLLLFFRKNLSQPREEAEQPWIPEEHAITFLGDKIRIERRGPGSAEIVSVLARETCEYCGQQECCYSCDESAGQANDQDTVLGRLQFNGGLDALESFLLSLVAAGVLTTSEDPKVNEALQSALDALGNNT